MMYDFGTDNLSPMKTFANKKEASRRSPRIRRLLFVVMFVAGTLVLTPQTQLYAQDTGDEEEQGEVTVTRVTPATSLERADMEHRLDNLIKGAMNNFFDPSTYLVNTGVSLELIRKQLPAETEAEQAGPRATEGLPGLPNIPASLLRRDRPADTPAPTDMVMELTGIQVTLFVAEDYTNQQIAFAERLVRATAKIDDERGDTVEIIRSEFPQRQDIAASPSPETEQQQDETVEPAPEDVDEPETAEATTDLPEWLYWAAGLLVLLLIAALIFYQRRKKKKQEAEASAFGGREGGLDQGEEAGTTAFAGNTDKSASAMEMQAESYLLQYMLRYPGEMARLFESWAVKEGEAGMNRAAGLLQLTDPKMVRVLRGAMSPDKFEQLQKLAGRSSQPLKQDAVREAERIHGYLKARFRDDTLRKGLFALNDFDFLDHITDKALLEAMESFSETEKALVLSHLESGRAGHVLQSFGRDEAGRIMMELPKLKQVTYPEYEKIAERLFDHTSGEDAPQLWTEEEVGQTVELIESLPISEQDAYAVQLMREHTDWSAAVSEKLITFRTLSKLDDERIADAIAPLDSQTIGAAISTLEEETAERILSLRPEREQMVIRGEMDVYKNLPDKRREAAMQRFLRAVRQSVRGVETAVPAGGKA